MLPSRLFFLFSLGTAEFGVGCMYGFNGTTPQTKGLTNFVDEFFAREFKIDAEQQQMLFHNYNGPGTSNGARPAGRDRVLQAFACRMSASRRKKGRKTLTFLVQRLSRQGQGLRQRTIGRY